MADASVPMTSKGYQFLMEELKRLKTVERPKNIREIEEARGHGDLSENAEFHAAKERQSLLDVQIREIEDKLARAQVIEVAKLSGDKVVFGATVALADGDTGDKVVYQIVGDHEAEPKNGKISISSPIARALIGRSEGDEVQVHTPTGVRTFDILSVGIYRIARPAPQDGAVLERQHVLFSQESCSHLLLATASRSRARGSQISRFRMAASGASGAARRFPFSGFHRAGARGNPDRVARRLSRRFQLGRPFPLEVELNNTGRPVEGALDVQVWKGGATKGGAPYLANYRREIFLPAQSRKTVQLTVDPDFHQPAAGDPLFRRADQGRARDRLAAAFFAGARSVVAERRGFSAAHFRCRRRKAGWCRSLPRSWRRMRALCSASRT